MAGVDRAQAVVERQNAIGEDRAAEGETERQRANRLDGASDVGQLKLAELALHRPQRGTQQQQPERRRERARKAREPYRHQAASAGRANAASISETVSARPYSATKPPKRGPSDWPSST